MRIPMAQIGHIAKGLRIPRFKIVWEKTSPVAFEFSACRIEFSPLCFSINWENPSKKPALIRPFRKFQITMARLLHPV